MGRLAGRLLLQAMALIKKITSLNRILKND